MSVSFGNVGLSIHAFVADRHSSDENKPSASDSSPITPNHSHTTRILLADDEPQVRRLIERVLVREGWCVTTAANGREAVELVENAQEPFDLIILDVQMPDMDGYSAYQAIRSQEAEPRVLFVSGYAEEAVWDLIHEEGLPRLRKPFGPRDLIQLVRGLLR